MQRLAATEREGKSERLAAEDPQNMVASELFLAFGMGSRPQEQPGMSVGDRHAFEDTIFHEGDVNLSMTENERFLHQDYLSQIP